MDAATATALTRAAGPALSVLVNPLNRLIELALGASQLEQRVILFLRIAQDCVDGLGRERQQILRDASLCDVRKASEVEALWKRMDAYLHQDNIRVHFQKAVDGLRGCQTAIKAQAISWRSRQNKQAAAEAFSRTLSELEGLLLGLRSNFYPWGSGMGVQTLGPIFDVLTGLRDGRKRKMDMDYDAAEEKLGDLIRQAIAHESNDEWITFPDKSSVSSPNCSSLFTGARILSPGRHHCLRLEAEVAVLPRRAGQRRPGHGDKVTGGRLPRPPTLPYEPVTEGSLVLLKDSTQHEPRSIRDEQAVGPSLVGLNPQPIAAQ